MATRSSKRQKTSDDVPFELIYWPGIPGRGEFIRLALEEAGAEYTDTAHVEKGVNAVLAQISDKNVGDKENTPPLAPPILKHGDLILFQTPNILLYLASKLPVLAPSPESDPNGIYHVNSLALTALDGLSNEAHDVHHPVATGLYYEDQKEEALRKAEDYRKTRLPKFLGYFQRVLSGPASNGEWLYEDQLTFADLVFFQALDGVTFAFPKRIKTMRDGGDYDKVFELYDRVKNKDRIKAYLESDRRQKYSKGIWRHYPELDDE